MINIGTTDFYLGVPSLPAEEFESYSTKLFDEWEIYVGDLLKLPDYHLALEVQEGSISAQSKILVRATALCGFLAAYGPISSGVKAMYSDIQSVGNYLGAIASAPFSQANVQPKIRNRGEALTKLESLFVRVGNGSLSVNEAMTLAESILGDDVPQFMEQLKTSLERTPSQMLLPMDEPEFQFNPPMEKDNKKKPAEKNRKVELARPDQYRIEIWRESKQSKKNVRIRKV
ncbi:hypothetical protein [Cellvibrio sp. BR]|uniref:hypothetical protein n=1 Tax=Cellvibrio sp. BR TaxID=1134474 RepID=UPI00030788D2|nr:hypothetical protein [Cellvibrio sp. BR]